MDLEAPVSSASLGAVSASLHPIPHPMASRAMRVPLLGHPKGTSWGLLAALCEEVTQHFIL